MTYQLYDYIGGKIWLDVDESQQMALRARSEYEPNKVKAMQDFLKPGMTFVDVGACHGYFTLLAAKLVGPTGRVLAFEPEPVNCGWLRRNVMTNKYENVQIFEHGLGSVTYKKLGLYLGEKSGQHSFCVNLGANVIYPQIFPLDDVMVGVPDAIKIDVEGWEADVLHGMKDIMQINKKQILLMVDLHPGAGWRQVFQELTLLYDFPLYTFDQESGYGDREYIGIREAQS